MAYELNSRTDGQPDERLSSRTRFRILLNLVWNRESNQLMWCLSNFWPPISSATCINPYTNNRLILEVSFISQLGKPPQAKVDISLKIWKAWLRIVNLELQLGKVSELYAYMQLQFCSATWLYTSHNYFFFSIRQWKLRKHSHKHLQM